jgi:glyoxylase-like metal-dependent hydrolase (beta-lactamase superfamily II)/rhodanese-related sulfurtransferase
MPIASWPPEVSPRELAQAIEAGEAVQVLDVRAPFRVSARIDLVPDERFHNIPGSQVMQRTDLRSTGLDPRIPVAVVCGWGNDSRVVTQHLKKLGWLAASVRGGMAAWGDLVLPRELPAPPPLDRLVQLDRVAKGALGYLLVSDGEAVIVDPPRDAAEYLREAAAANSRVVAVCDTHVHADYVSGAPELARALGVPYRLHPKDAVYPYDGTPGRIEFEPLGDGATIGFGRCTLRARHTPGHTEGSLTFLVDDAAAFTGDFLFVASIGRPDLAGKVTEWTAELWRSVEAAKREWPDHLLVYPAHYASEAERRADRTVGEPFGRLRERNGALSFSDRAAFASWVQGKTASFPEVYRKIKAVNVALLSVDAEEARELDVGRNECALGGTRLDK